MAGGMLGFFLSGQILDLKSEETRTASANRPQVSVFPTFQVIPDDNGGGNLQPAIALDIRF